jgi:protein ImuB
MNSPRRYLVAHLPVFRLERCGWEPDQLVVLADEERSALRVQAATPAAAAAGVRIGMTVTQARAICPSVQVERLAEREEAEDLAELATQLLRISPTVAPLAPNALVAEISRTATVLARSGDGPPPQRAGAERAMVERVRRLLSRLGHVARVVVADDPSTALACAAWGQTDRVVPPEAGPAALAPLPLAALGLPDDSHDLLIGLGIRTVGEFAALPPASVVGRFPPLVLLAHQLACGTARPPVLPSEADDDSVALRQDLPSPVVVLESLLFVINAMLSDITARLAATGRAAVHMGLSFGLEQGGWQHLSIRLGAPTRDARRILSLIRARMERVELAGPAEVVFLEVVDPLPFDGRQRDLVDRQRATEQLADVTARLQDTLGVEQLGIPRLVDHHRPESAWRNEPIVIADLGAPVIAPSGGAAVAVAHDALRAPSTLLDPRPPKVRAAIAQDPAAEWTGFAAPLPVRRPILLLPQAVAIDVQTGPGGRPTALHHDSRWIGITTVDGPERRSGAWWEDRPYAREYWRVSLRDGRQAWIYREDHRWALHGWWDAESA